MAIEPQYEDAIKNSEGSADGGWDYKQYSGPYGVKRAPDEVLSQDQALQRFQSELGNANTLVRSLGVPMTKGQEAALTSLTYNAGPKWMKSGLGEAVKNQDWNTAKQIFLQYTHAGGLANPGLERRRAQEAAWFDEPDPGAASADGQSFTLRAPSRSSSPAQQGPSIPPETVETAQAQLAPAAKDDALGTGRPTPGVGGVDDFIAQDVKNPAAPLVAKAADMMAEAQATSPASLPSFISNRPDSAFRVQQALNMARAAMPFGKKNKSIIPSLQPGEEIAANSPKSPQGYAEGGIAGNSANPYAHWSPGDRQSNNIEDRTSETAWDKFPTQLFSTFVEPFQRAYSNLSHDGDLNYQSPQMQSEMQQMGDLMPKTEANPYSGPAYHVPNTDPESRDFNKLQGQLRDSEDVQHLAMGGPAWFAKSEARGMTHQGPLLSAVPGRTDQLPATVRAGSFVWPADVVSALGQGNTLAGNNVISAMARNPFGLPKLHGSTQRVAKMPSASSSKTTTKTKTSKLFADGGMPYGDMGDDRVPVILAGGEYVSSPEEVAAWGDGDVNNGHAILNEFVRNVRANNIKTLKSLPDPKK